MESIRSKRIENLENAALDETSAASSLVSSIRSARASAEKMSLESFESSIAQVNEAARNLTLKDSKRTKLTRELTTLLGLPPDLSLLSLAAALGAPGRRLREISEKLSEELRTIAGESLVLSVCAKHGAAVSGHLTALASSGASYNPRGRINSAKRLQGTRA